MQLNYNWTDNNKSESIVLLHGFLSDMESLSEIADELSRDYNVLRIDLPGFGKSPLESIDVSFLDVLERIKAVIDKLKLERVHLFGYSMGGRLAVALLVNYPKLFHSAILESTTVGIKDVDARAKRLQVDIARAGHVKNDFESFLDEWEAMPLFESRERLSESSYHAQRENRSRQDPLLVARSLLVYGTGVQPYFGDLFTHVECPILLIVGKNDSKFVKINTAMNKSNEWSELVIIDNAGHNVHLESPEAFYLSVLKFLKNVKE